MKVILIQDVQNLGSIGDIIEVKDGFARNYLFPKKLAMPATQANTRQVEEIKLKKAQALAREKKEAEALKEKLSLISCTLTVEAGEDDKLFGSVTSEDIAKAFEEEGILLDKKKIMLEEPIKRLGVYHVPVKLHPEVTAEVKVWVVKR